MTSTSTDASKFGAQDESRLLDGRVALLTGAARGCGAAVAMAFARHGASLAVVDIDGPAAQRSIDRVRSETDAPALAISADVAVADDATRAVIETLASFSRLDILVNNAGVLTVTPFLDMNQASWERALAVNLTGPMHMMQAAARRMSKRASIINVTSVGAEIAAPGMAAYCASKGGLQMLTRSTALELAPRGIRVNAIAPGLILTDMARELYETKERLDQVVEGIPLGRPGYPDDLVGAALYLASDLSAYVTGSTLLVDGGLLLT